MRELSERDKDNLAAILDYCDRISSIVAVEVVKHWLDSLSREIIRDSCH